MTRGPAGERLTRRASIVMPPTDWSDTAQAEFAPDHDPAYLLKIGGSKRLRLTSEGRAATKHILRRWLPKTQPELGFRAYPVRDLNPCYHLERVAS